MLLFREPAPVLSVAAFPGFSAPLAVIMIRMPAAAKAKERIRNPLLIINKSLMIYLNPTKNIRICIHLAMLCGLRILATKCYKWFDLPYLFLHVSPNIMLTGPLQALFDTV